MRLRLLVVGDAHARLDAALRLRAAVGPVDAVVAAGDLLNVDHSLARLRTLLLPTSSSPPSVPAQILERQKSAAELSNLTGVLAALARLTPSGSSVFFVPGNHDPAFLYSDVDPLDTSSLPFDASAIKCAHNIHLKHYRIAPGLHLAGLGGSIPTTRRLNTDLVVHREYPYTEQMYKDKLHQLFNQPRYLDVPPVLKPPSSTSAKTRATKLYESLISESISQTILVTHNGPASISTTDENLNPTNAHTRCETGSFALYEHLSQRLQKQNGPAGFIDTDIFLNIHGHAHHSQGLARIASLPVINPGPMRDGFFSVLELERKVSRGLEMKWHLRKAEFGSLD